ncbi:hypothetical protein MAPG_07215 [Magnaporthiopsis poae ATCC 64411]|uniref:Uncharacterized protein n=1 Tax=Magnaporthiopsis poae (strain ATCC 64411 / 73-15) TaxID=644358 RepID=A0A0C4E427_MAGP6|nr:hypothetical protein MAPG_07215 [Magnaporthiopsis poae ATCC 64411]
MENVVILIAAPNIQSVWARALKHHAAWKFFPFVVTAKSYTQTDPPLCGYTSDGNVPTSWLSIMGSNVPLLGWSSQRPENTATRRLLRMPILNLLFKPRHFLSVFAPLSCGFHGPCMKSKNKTQLDVWSR